MSESIVLEVRSRDAGPSRRIEVEGSSLRIGRGDQCEVKLGGSPLADVQCMLRRRGQTWHVQPIGPPGRISLQGRAVEQTRPIPLEMEFQVGDHWLSLRPIDRPGLTDWTSSASQESEVSPLDERFATDAATPSWGDRIADRERRLDAGLRERRWAARWKAAGAQLKAKSQDSTPPPRANAAARPLPTVRDATAGSFPPHARIARKPRIEEGPAAEPATIAALRVEFRSPPSFLAPEVREIATPVEEIVREAEPVARAAEPRVEAESVPVAETLAAMVPTIAEPTPESGGHPAEVEIAASVVVQPETVAPAQPARRRRNRASLGVASVGLPVEEPVAEPIADVPGIDFGVLLKLMMEAPLTMANPAGADAIPTFTLPTPPMSTLIATEPEPIDVAFDEPGVTTDEPIVLDEAGTSVEVEVEDATPAWPSARTMIGPRQRPHPAQAASGPRSRKRRPEAPTPTAARAPGHWTIPAPGWLWGPSVAAAAIVGVAGLGLSWAWARDDQAAGRMADRLLAPGDGPDAQEAEALLAETGGEAPWWRTTAGHLLWKAALADRAGAEAREQVPNLLRSAQGSAPAHAATRLARAQAAGLGGTPGPLAESLGLSRDVASLTWTGRKLAEAGKVEPALNAYRAALALVAATPEAEQSPPRPIGDGSSRRMALPGEELVEPILRELAAQPGWTFDRWQSALPKSGVAPLVAARILRELGRIEAEPALDAALALADGSPVGRAARAEALILKGRTEEATTEYTRAIAETTDGLSRRAWSFNLAEACSRLHDDARRQAAWDAARGGGPGDEITRQVAEARARAGADRPVATIARSR